MLVINFKSKTANLTICYLYISELILGRCKTKTSITWSLVNSYWSMYKLLGHFV